MANTFIFDDDEQPGMGGSEPGQGDQPDESESGNRNTFTIVAIVIGVIILLSLICMVGIAVFYLPGRAASQGATSTSAAATAAQNALVAQQTQVAAQASPTLSATPVLTDTPTDTPVVVFATDTPANPQDPATATVQALQTQLANAQLTVTFAPSAIGGTRTKTRTVTTTPQIPKTGFADEVGLPGMFIVAMILLGVILLARRLRNVSNE